MNQEIKSRYLNALFESHMNEIDPVFTHPDIVADEIQNLLPLYQYIQKELSTGDTE